MSALVNYGLIDPNLTQGVMTKGYDAYIDRGNALVQQERANKLADLQYNQAMDAENQRRALQSFMKNADPKAPNFKEGLRMIVGPQGVMDYDAKEAGTASAKLDLRVKQDDFLDKLRKNLSRNPSDENVTAWGQDAVIEGLYSEEEAKATVQQLLQMPLEERVRSLAPQPTQPDSAEVITMRRLGFPMTPEGYAQFRDTQRQDRMLSQEEEAQKIRIAGATRPPPPTPTPAAPVAVVDPVTGKPRFASREEAIEQGLAPASAQETGIAPKEILARNARYPAQTQAIKAFEAQSTSFANDMRKLLNHPGLSGITGIIAGRSPNITGDARAAQALYDKIVAKGGFSVLQAIREASKTGGALGNLSNQEGTQLKAAFAAINQTQDTDDVKASLTQAIEELEGSKARMREAYDSTYEYKNTETAPETPREGGASGSFDAPTTSFPAAAVKALKAGKGTDAQFDAIFGPGAAKLARGSQ